ncbi:MAG: hypothetical protein AAGK78_15980, partial [Planctomycetota bacterium]
TEQPEIVDAQEIVGRTIYDIAATRDGQLLLAAAESLHHVSPSPMQSPADLRLVRNDLLGTRFAEIEPDGDGGFWLGGRSLAHVDVAGRLRLIEAQGLQPGFMQHLAPDKGGVWIAQVRVGIGRYDDATRTVTYLTPPTSVLAAGFAATGAAVHGQRVYIGSRQGLHVYDTGESEWIDHWAHDTTAPNAPGSLSGHTVTRVCIVNGRVLVATENGVDEWNLATDERRRLFDGEALWVDAAVGSDQVWVATRAGVVRIDGDGNTQRFREGLPDQTVTGVVAGPAGVLAVTPAGTCRLRDTGRFESIPGVRAEFSENSAAFTNDGVIALGDRGIAWAGASTDDAKAGPPRI